MLPLCNLKIGLNIACSKSSYSFEQFELVLYSEFNQIIGFLYTVSNHLFIYVIATHFIERIQDFLRISMRISLRSVPVTCENPLTVGHDHVKICPYLP